VSGKGTQKQKKKNNGSTEAKNGSCVIPGQGEENKWCGVGVILMIGKRVGIRKKKGQKKKKKFEEGPGKGLRPMQPENGGKDERNDEKGYAEDSERVGIREQQEGSVNAG